MRRSIRVSRNRMLAIGASILLFGSVLAAAAIPAQAARHGQAAGPAQAAPLVAFAVTVANPGLQTIDPLSTAADLAIGATDTDVTGPPLTFTATGLPPGLGIASTDTTDAAITGTITAAGTYSVTVTATDVNSVAGSATFTMAASNTVTVANMAAQNRSVGVKVSVQPSAADSDPGQDAHLTWDATDLPDGLSINPATGLISGRPTKPIGVATIVTATDAYGESGTTTITWVITEAVIIVNQGPQTTTVGQWKKNNPFKVTDAVPGDKPTFSATGLPPGMGFQGSPMLLYGWPTRAGTYSVKIHEKGSLGTIDQTTFKLTVKPAPNKGATGLIHLALDAKCLLDPGGETVNGTPVQIANCVSGATERWTVVSDGTVRVNGRCLQIAGSGSSAGRQLQLGGCGNANPRQLWAQGTSGELINPASGLCVTDPGASRKSGAVPAMGTCRVNSAEQWTLPSQPLLTALGGSCADDHYSQGNNGAVVDMFWCNDTAGQAWSFRPDGTIRAGLFSDKCVTVRNSKTVLYTCASGNSSQKWAVVRTGVMSSELTQAGVCLAIPSMTSAKGTLLEPNGTQLTTSRCSKTDPRDLWHIA
jgi:Ricin-type beta-trefoil lectin domain/Putative Ig domain